MPNCPQCGKLNKDTAVFCIFCGNSLKENAEGVFSFPPQERQGKQAIFDSAQEEKKQEEEKNIPPAGIDGFLNITSIQNGRYQITKILGQGGMGRVMLAQDTKMKCTVVIKQMLPFFTSQKDKEYFEKRFVGEAQLLFRLRHPNLPRVSDFFFEDNNMFLVMDFIPGKDLEKVMLETPDKKLGIAPALQWMKEVLKILEYLHTQTPPILHRDIKPSNIMLTDQGEICLLDFGIARQMGTSPFTSVGTYGFASPDHIQGDFCPSSDIFSAGATFHFLLTGDDPSQRMPFDFPPLSRYRQDISPELQSIFDKILAQKKEDRYPNAQQVLQDLNRLDQQGKPPTPRKTKDLPTPPPTKTTPKHDKKKTGSDIKKEDNKENKTPLPSPVSPAPVSPPKTKDTKKSPIHQHPFVKNQGWAILSLTLTFMWMAWTLSSIGNHNPKPSPSPTKSHIKISPLSSPKSSTLSPSPSVSIRETKSIPPFEIAPDSLVSRGELCRLIADYIIWADNKRGASESLEYPTEKGGGLFSDISPQHPHYWAILHLVNKGIAEGLPDGTIEADQQVQKFQLAMYLARLVSREETKIEEEKKKFGENFSHFKQLIFASDSEMNELPHQQKQALILSRKYPEDTKKIIEDMDEYNTFLQGFKLAGNNQNKKTPWDIPEKHWAKDSVLFLLDRGIIELTSVTDTGGKTKYLFKGKDLCKAGDVQKPLSILKNRMEEYFVKSDQMKEKIQSYNKKTGLLLTSPPP